MVSLAPYRRRLSLTTAVLTALATGLVAASAPAHAAPPAASSPVGKPAAPKPADPIAAAIAKARSQGSPASIGSLTDEFSTTAANPDGTLTTVYSASPQRARQGDSWVPIDTTLVERSDGSLAPRAATGGLVIAADRSTRLLSLKEGSRELVFTWPRALPAPVVSGDTATFREVYAGVDLQITADAGGYSSVFVVKTREAAANPQLHTIDFGITGTNVRIRETTGGGAEAVDVAGGAQVFHTDSAFMWDSTPVTGTAGKSSGTRVADGPSSREPGRNMAEVKIDIEGGKQLLTLDQDLLTAPSTTFPVYVDPYWSGSPGKGQLNWARISSNGWDYYNSTSKTGATSARIGLDEWPGGEGEKARTYYQMNTSGIKGAQIFEANLYVVHRWSASCGNTPAVVYGTHGPSSWGSSGLRWDKQPTVTTGVLSTVNARELDCGTSKQRPSPASLNFNVLSHIKTAAASKVSGATFLVKADEGERMHWKQLGYGGGATLSVRYSYKPQFINGTGNPRVTPSVVDQGRIVTTTSTPTLSAQGFTPKVNGLQENVQIYYQVFNSAGTKVISGYGPSGSYNLNGSPWQVHTALADGNYTWNATIKNASGIWGGVYSASQAFTIDTTAPKAPGIASTQFPPGQLGGAYSDRGVFALTNDRTNNVTGYLFTLDGDLTDVTYAPGRDDEWQANTVIQPGKVYFAVADFGDGTGPLVINGSAGVRFAPGTVGAHKLAAKAVDQAGTTSPQTVYSFHAGTSTPTFATGDNMISGWTATNSDGTTTTVPPATTTTRTGRLIAQQHSRGFYFHTGIQAFLGNTSATSKVALGDSATVYLNVPAAGSWEIGANVTTGLDYGTYTLTLDKGTSTAQVLTANLDTYGSPTSTKYLNFGTLTDGNGVPRQLTKGLHSVTLDVTGKNSASTGYQAGIDVLRLAPTPTCPINNTTACLNNTAISTYTPGTPPTVTTADATGNGTSFDAAGLRAAGWTPGATVTVNGAAIKLPAAFGTGAPDNMLSNGQIITLPATGVLNSGNALVLAGFASGTIPAGAKGTITYAAGCDVTSQAYVLDPVADWAAALPGDTVLTVPRRNKNNATQENVPVSLFTISVPLKCPGVPITSISLPLVTNAVTAGAPSLHVLGLGIRPTSATGTGSTSARWAGSWAAAQDTATVKAQASGTTTVDATLNNQTLRIPTQLSIGTAAGHRARLRLANSLGTTPVTFDAVSLALQDTTAGGAAAAANPVAVTFAGAREITLPVGADVLSDPIALAVPDRTTVLVSIKARGNLSTLSGHQDGRTRIYLSAADNTDHTGEKAATSFTQSAMLGTPFLSGIDVTTPAANPAGSVVLFGDQTVNADTAGNDGHSQLDNRIAEALAAAPETGNTVPLGLLNLGSSNWGNKAKLPAGSSPRPATAQASVDRAILNQSNVRAVLISSGSSDLLSCTAGSAQACADPVKTRLVALAAQLKQFKTDDAGNTHRTPFTEDGALKVYVATLPPFTTTATAVQETARQQVNDYILGINGSNDLQGNTDGVINFAEAVSTGQDRTSSTTGDDYLSTGSPRTPNDEYYRALAEQYLLDIDPTDWITDESGGTEPGADPIATWKFNDGSGTTVADTGSGTGSAQTKHPATLHQAGWGSGRIVRRAAGTFNGSSSYAETDLNTNTVQSFTISAWVRLTDKSSDRTVFARESDGFASLALRYQQATDR